MLSSVSYVCFVFYFVSFVSNSFDVSAIHILIHSSHFGYFLNYCMRFHNLLIFPPPPAGVVAEKNFFMTGLVEFSGLSGGSPDGQQPSCVVLTFLGCRLRLLSSPQFTDGCI